MDIQDAKIRLPAVVLEKRVIVGAEVVRGALGRKSRVEHATQSHTVYITGVHTKANDAVRELVHDHEYPVAFQTNGFTPKQVNVPEAILCVPRWPTATRFWPVIYGEDTPHHIFIDVDSKAFVDLLRDPRASEPWVASFQFNDSLDEFC